MFITILEGPKNDLIETPPLWEFHQRKRIKTTSIHIVKWNNKKKNNHELYGLQATDSHLYLMLSSCRPPHTFKGVPKGLATRIRRICSSLIFYQEQNLRLKAHLCKRGYEAPKVHTATRINDMSNEDRQSFLQYKEKSTGNRFLMVTTYHLVLKDLNTILKKTYPHSLTNQIMAEVFKEPPLTAIRRPRNLKDMVVESSWRILYPMAALKPVKKKDVWCANLLQAPTVSKALSPVDFTEYWGNRPVEVTTASTWSAAKFVRNNMWLIQVVIDHNTH